MHIRATTAAAAALGLGLGLTATLSAQYTAPSPAAKTGHEGHGSAGAAAAGGATLSAKLVDPDAKAKKQSAVVEVMVKGLELVDPAKVNEKPAKGQGHLHYQVDDGPVIATTTPKMSFHGLKPGPHTVLVALAANDHSALGPQEKLSVTVP
jgi:hypothetical protein